MKRNISIYLADLSHDTVGLATEVFPLNVGYIAAYAKKKFEDCIDVCLFKYIPDLEEAIENNPPDILALSNYPWCENVGLAMFELLAERRPDALRIMGGPNFPHELSAQEIFLVERPLIDAYTYLDGEISFSNIVELTLDCEDITQAREMLKTVPVNGCVQIGKNGKSLAPVLPNRIRELDEIPSPYLMGLLDPFFDGRLSPMIQTHRGCPFQCTFCADGSSLVSKVNKFSTERTIQELQYIAERVPESMKALHIADLNFGMFKQDLDICDAIKTIKQKFNYPLYIDTSTGKNSKKRIINAIEKLDGVLGLGMSVQTMTPEVLKNIKRDNIRLEDFIGIKQAIKAANLPTTSEIILGLPGETMSSHLDSLNKLMVMEIENISPYTLMLLNGSEMSTSSDREKWGFKTKFRVLPRDFTILKNGKRIIEIEEVVVESKSLSYEDYIYCRKIAYLISFFNTPGYKSIIKILLQNNIPPIDLFVSVLKKLDELAAENSQCKDVLLMCDFESETRQELWDTAEEVTNFFQDPDHFQGLIDGTFGANLIQTYRGKTLAGCLAEFSELFFGQAMEVLVQHTSDTALMETMREAIIYSKGIVWNILGTDRLEITPIAKLNFDFHSWIADPEEKLLTEYSLETSSKVVFPLSDEQYKLVEDSLERFGRSDLGVGKAVLRLNPNVLWRKPDIRKGSMKKFASGKVVYLN